MIEEMWKVASKMVSNSPPLLIVFISLHNVLSLKCALDLVTYF